MAYRQPVVDLLIPLSVRESPVSLARFSQAVPDWMPIVGLELPPVRVLNRVELSPALQRYPQVGLSFSARVERDSWLL